MSIEGYDIQPVYTGCVSRPEIALNISTQHSYQEKAMTTQIPGVYRNGQIVLSDIPESLHDEMPVTVIFNDNSPVVLRESGINEDRALELREQLSVFAGDWEGPDMSIYDGYDGAVRILTQRRKDAKV